MKKKDPENGLVNEERVLENFKALMNSGITLHPEPTKEEQEKYLKVSKKFRKGVKKLLRNYKKTGSFSKNPKS
jgi:uncharacterized protein YifE (UPF0438 family)